MESFEIILERYDGQMSTESKIAYTEKKNDIYKNLLKSMSSLDLQVEVKSTLDQLCSKGIKLAIGSLGKNVRFILKRLELENYFDVICNEKNISQLKPDPEVFIKATQFLNEIEDKCLVVEDATSGLESAGVVGMDCARVRDASESELATYRLSKFEDLLNIIE